MGRGWSDGAKVSCILRHRDDQLIFAYSWTSTAILVAGKGSGEWVGCGRRGGGGGYFVCFFTFIPVPFFSFCLSFLLLSLLSLSSLSLGDLTKWPWSSDVSLNPNIIKIVQLGATKPCKARSTQVVTKHRGLISIWLGFSLDSNVVHHENIPILFCFPPHPHPLPPLNLTFTSNRKICVYRGIYHFSYFSSKI